MKYYKFIVSGLLLFFGFRYYTNASQLSGFESDEETRCEQPKRVRLETPQTYRLVLAYNGQSLEFAKELLDQSNRFTAEINFLISSGRPNERELPVTQYITEVHSDNLGEVTLQDLHAILSVLAEHRDRQQEALEKLLVVHPSSLAWLMNLVGVAGYYDIPPLFTYATARFGKEFAEHATDAPYRAALATLPDTWQMAITPYSVQQNKTIRHFLAATPLKALQGHAEAVRGIAWSPDSKQLAAVGADGLRIWDVASGMVVRTLQGPENLIYSVAWSPDGKQLALGMMDGTIKIWNVVTSTLVRTLQGSENLIYSIAWSPDGAQLASASADGTFKLWDVATGTLVRIWQSSSGLVNTLAWSPDSKQLASGSVDRTIKLWYVATGNIVRTLKGHTNWVRSVAWSPDGKQLASASDDHTIKLWDVAKGNLVSTLQGIGAWVRSVAWSPDGMQLASASDDITVKLWDVATSTVIRTLDGHMGKINAVAWSPDGTQVASGSDDKTIALWPTSAQLLQLTIPQLDLLEKMITEKKKEPLPEEASVYESLPAVWKQLLAN
jgi:WD40 repeat protein